MADVLYTPSVKQRSMRAELAQRIREGLSRSNKDLLQDEVLQEALYGKWLNALRGADKADEVFSKAFHALQHYFADADIRMRDPRYAEQTRIEMRKLAEQLEAQ